MARRAAPANATPAFFTAPPRRQIADPNESALSRFIREQITAPEKLPGNISIMTGVSVFAAGIFVARTWGDIDRYYPQNGLKAVDTSCCTCISPP
ncbi:uncharacterized protein F5891DRAFT_1190455 [Suillus fuscotomentosus]|uniref:Uncharacterized protein n=1 Tax=Suillus fuscotomentosus TaxID=1912939 RepID=A0AAD4E567_9AGAM|nr:uncharacterized protein F5891DRAFT_1190455 [Suillus fuscotomentosus]KAG1898684.1 hypothetical protein F5891DRAFT_1190455 [Suillus fuscotomentosus]